jgi:hypothetical protein
MQAYNIEYCAIVHGFRRKNEKDNQEDHLLTGLMGNANSTLGLAQREMFCSGQVAAKSV